MVSVLHKVGLNRGLTLSVQSMNDRTLESIERKNMEISKLSHMYKECDKQGVTYYTEFILGMPYETKQSWREGLCKAVEAGCHYFLDVYPLEILKNSKLNTQINQHKLEILNFKTIYEGQPSRIPESHNYVVATAYINRQDYIDSWMWSWLILNFHHYAWTQVLAKFAHSHLGISYIQFYEDFYNQCVLKDPMFLNLHQRQEAALKDFFCNTNSNRVFDNDNVVVITDQIKWHTNRHTVQQSTSNWAVDYFSSVDARLLNNVITFNNHYVVDMDRKCNLELELEYNIHEACNFNSKLENNPVRYTLTNSIDWGDAKDFKDKLFYKNRSGFSVQRVSR